MKQFTTTLLLLFVMLSFGQKGNDISEEIVEAIKKDVWVPFMESYEELDPNKLKSIHSPEIVRVSIDQNEIKSGESYLAYFGDFLVNVKQKEGKVEIAFAILSTAVDGSKEMAYQTGYYRFSSLDKKTNKMVVRGYGYFNVGLKLEDNVWKIWLDSDKRADITGKDFSNQKIIYELGKPS